MFGPKAVHAALQTQSIGHSDAHRRVAECALGFNERVNTQEELQSGLDIILGYTEDQIKLVTVETLREKGLPV